jgi:hypothetical protein
VRVNGRIAALLAMVAAVVALPASAWGSVVVGSDLANPPDSNGSCSAVSDCTIVQTVSPRTLKSPVSGVVTSWSTLGGSGTVGTFGTPRLRILREAAGGAYTAVRSGPVTSIPTSLGHPLITLSLSPGLPISQGDLVGIDQPSGTYLADRSLSGYTYGVWTTVLADGATRTPDANGSRELLFQATIEPTDTFTVGTVTRNKKKGTAALSLTLPNAGDLTASGKGAKIAAGGAAAISKAVGAGAAQLLVKAKGKQRKTLNSSGKVKLNVAITYTPTGGTPYTQSIKVKLKKNV